MEDVSQISLHVNGPIHKPRDYSMASSKLLPLVVKSLVEILVVNDMVMF